MLNLFFRARYPQRHFSWGQRWCSGWCLEGGRKMISFLDQGSGVKAGAPTDVSYFFELIHFFWGQSTAAGALSDGTFSADVRARVLIYGRQGTCHEVEEAVLQ